MKQSSPISINQDQNKPNNIELPHNLEAEQQLLGALPKSNKPGLGSDSKYAPVSQYWFPENDEDVPLKNWAENNLIKSNLI